MKIYEIKSDFSICDNFYINDEIYADREYMESFKFDKGFLINGWKGIELKGDVENTQVISDMAHFWGPGRLMMIGKELKDKIDERYNGYIQWLKVNVDDNREYYLGHILNIINCVDYNKSDFNISLGTPSSVNKYVFTDEALNEPIFKIILNTYCYSSYIFVNDEFKTFIESNGIKGFKFEEVYEFKN